MFWKLILLLSIALSPIIILGQWTNMNVPLQAGWGSEIEAVDYDLDGDLDIFLCGSSSSEGVGYANLYRNDGNWNFTSITTGITGVYRGYSAWADYNNDGYMDVVITGRNNESALPIAKLYIGTSNHSFTYVPMNWTGMYYSWVDAGDYNNDGLIDIIMTGVNSGVDYVKLYLNEGNLVFSEVNAGLENTSTGQCHMIDYDNDGDLDISIIGSGANIIYQNEGTDTFINIGAVLRPLRNCISDWGDFDNDGLMDLLISGEGETNHSYLYKNHGNGQFSQIESPLPGVIVGSLFWGDYNNDGLLDIIVTGGMYHYGPRVTKIYKNNGDRTFSDINAPFPQVSSSKAIWADLDNDGRLDVILAGYNGTGYEAKIFRNETEIANSSPNPPAVHFDQATGIFSFSGSSDDTTPEHCLSYNLRIGTTPGGDDIFSVMESANGFRRTVANGRRKIKFDPEPIQTYYASAQAIDYSFMGSAFGPELVFILQGTPLIAVTGADSLNFGSVGIGEVSQQQAIQLLNTGTAVLRIDGVSLTVPNSGFHIENSGFPYLVNPGDSISFDIYFSPLQIGQIYSSLNIFSNAVNSSQVAVSLYGCGISMPIPEIVEGLTINRQEYDVILNWLPVTLDISGNPITVDRYVVLISETSDPQDFMYFGNTTSTTFTHYGISLSAPLKMYRVVAIKFDRAEQAIKFDLLTNKIRFPWVQFSELIGTEN